MESEWMRFFTLAGIPDGIATRYSSSFAKNRVKREMVGELDKETLVQLGVTAVGDQMAILKRVKAVAAMEAAGTGHTKKTAVSSASTRVTRAPIAAPSMDDRFTSLDDRCASVQRRGKPPPDRHEIYHVKMPEGKTAKSRKIMQNLHELRKNGMLVRGSSGVRQSGREVMSVAEQRELDAEVSSTTGGRMGGMHVDRVRGGGIQTGRVLKKRIVGGGSSSGLFGAAISVAGSGSVLARKRPLRVERVEGGRGGGLPSVTVELGNRVRMVGGAVPVEKKMMIGGNKRGLAGRVQGGQGGVRRGVVVQYEDEEEEEEMEEMMEEEEMYEDEGEEEEVEYEEEYEDEMEDSSTIIVGPSRGGQRVQTRYVPIQQNQRGGHNYMRRAPIVERNASIFDRVSF